MINLKRLDEEIAALRKDWHSACFLEGVVAHDAKGIDSEENLLESAVFYGDSKKLARIIQLVFIRTLAKRPGEGEAWAAAALERMDLLDGLSRELKGLNTPRDVLIRQIAHEDDVGNVGC